MSGAMSEAMAVRLDDIRDSFEGVIPSVIATTDKDGMPNISYLSHVYYVDEAHVALSNQFFSKTDANVRHHGLATVMVVDGKTGAQHILDLRFLEAKEEGRLFARVSSHLAVTSAQHGMAGIMKLRTIDIYRVEACRAVVPVAPLVEPPVPVRKLDRLQRAAQLAGRIAEELDVEAMLDCVMDGLRDRFDFQHAMLLVPHEDAQRLTTIASRGYARFGVGAEMMIGEGTIGMAAASRHPVRISDMRRGRRYASAVRAAVQGASEGEIPLPQLAEPQSQLAVPMLSRGRLIGVIFVESAESFAFSHQDEDALVLIASQLAASLNLAELERIEPRPAAPPPPKLTRFAPAAKPFRFRYYPLDGGVFVDDEYLIRGVPGRLLHHFVQVFLDTGRQEFSNREMRRDASLGLPEFKDNLETRLILLSRRLQEKGGPIRLSRPERGQIRIEFDGEPKIEIVTAQA
jgi:hypothetical protein